MSPWNYISFASDAGFLGGCIVRGDDTIAAVKEAHRLGCNPGGEALCCPVPEHLMPNERYCNRLLQKAEIDECWNDCDTLGNLKKERHYDIPDDAALCEHRNAAVVSETGSVDTKGGG